jgi:hypothetical protein
LTNGVDNSYSYNEKINIRTAHYKGFKEMRLYISEENPGTIPITVILNTSLQNIFTIKRAQVYVRNLSENVNFLLN